MTNGWDVFISHASEDKKSVARPLASKLRRLGLTVWLDENELKLGDSLSRKIDEGLTKSSMVLSYYRGIFSGRTGQNMSCVASPQR
ncbi:MAG TPA: toll/interleukin-1 receptor domain-containing protein [Allosphingosinicella sp.]|nr:toll/interleukin-1 receptor domain-containing protein [Allosphingosinicella sp.]